VLQHDLAFEGMAAQAGPAPVGLGVGVRKLVRALRRGRVVRRSLRSWCCH